MENKVETVENTEKKKEPMTTKQKVFLGLRIAFNVVFYALIIFLFLFSLMNIRGGNGTTNFPNIFGKGFLSVQSPSMERDEKFKDSWPVEWKNYKIGEIKTGDLVNADVISSNDASKLKVGDVIVFSGAVNGNPALITHRIVDINKDSSGKVTGIITQGDNKAQTAPYNPNASEIEKYSTSGNWEAVTVESLRGIVTGVNSGAGKVLDTIQKNWLFIFVIPIIVLLVIEIFLVVRNIMLLRGEKNKLELADTKEAMLAEVEAEKEKMRQELLAELRAQGLAPAEDPKSEEPEATPEPQEEATKDAVVLTADEEKTEEPQEEVKEETKVEETSEEAPAEETKEEEPTIEETKEPEVVEEKVEEAPVEETPQEEAQPEVQEPQEEVKEEIKEETLEEKKETPKKASPKKSSTTTKKSTSTTKKKTTSTTKKSTKKTEE